MATTNPKENNDSDSSSVAVEDDGNQSPISASSLTGGDSLVSGSDPDLTDQENYVQ